MSSAVDELLIRNRLTAHDYHRMGEAGRDVSYRRAKPLTCGLTPHPGPLPQGEREQKALAFSLPLREGLGEGRRPKGLGMRSSVSVHGVDDASAPALLPDVRFDLRAILG